MLQQILRDLYVDPEILSALDESQKQTLFCKMREEQVRRWRLWDEKCNGKLPQKDKEDSGHKTSKKSVSFLKGNDGEPWVWVMGEHENDMSIDDILKEEAMDSARQLAEREAEALREQLIDCMDLTPKIDDDIYCSVDVLKMQIKPPPSLIKHGNNGANRDNHYTIGHYQNKPNHHIHHNNNNNNKYNNVIDTNEVLNELNINATKKVAQKVALWERRLTEERTCEILQNIQSKRLEAAKEAEENDKIHEVLWKEQERKAKEAEQQIREIARKAREEHRLTTCKLEFEPAYSAVAPGVPPGKQAVIDWYKKQEIPRRAGLDHFNHIEPYFHGLITRNGAETLLQNQPDGTFLVRLSERLWGYAISYKAKDKCKHYLVNAVSNYSFLGNNQVEHRSLGELISYHKECPLSGGEKLIKPCPRFNEETIWELFDHSSKCVN